MAANPTLVVGIALALTAGPVLAILAPSFVEASSTSDAPTLRVPPGAIGDQVLYAAFQRNESNDPWSTLPAWQFTVTSSRTSPQSDGKLRSTATVAMDARYANWTQGRLGEIANDYRYVSNLAIDLEDRNLVGLDWFAEGNVTNFGAIRAAHQSANTFYGPFPGWLYRRPHWSAPADGYWGFYPLSHAGTALRIGDELPNEPSRLLFSVTMGTEITDGAADVAHEARSWVAEAGTIQGREAIDLRTEGCLRPALVAGTWHADQPEYQDGLDFLHTSVPIGSTACYTVDVWLAPDVPYPILYHERTVIDGTVRHEHLETLTSFRPGSRPIPWHAPAPPGTAFTFELTQGTQRHPADGTGSRMWFPLSMALRAAETDPTLVRLQAWKAAHPDAFLIGARLHPPMTTQPDLLAWHLVFGSPNGDQAGSAFVVSSHKWRHAATPTQRDVGEYSTPPIHLEEFPQNQITIASAEKIWFEHSRADHEPLAPVAMWWGYLYLPPHLDCRDFPTCRENAAGTLNPDSGDWMMIGNRKMFDTVEVFRIARTLGEALRSQLFVDTAPARVSTNIHSMRGDYYSPLAAAAIGSPAEPPEQKTAPAVNVDAFQWGAVVSTSALALLLAAYFFPLLRFFGTSAVGTVFGYAKLRRSALLDKRIRDDLVGLIRRDPGVTTSQLARTVAAGWSTVVYHLRVLETNHLVSSLIDGRHKRFFPVDQIDWASRGRLAILKNTRTRQLYDTIRQEPGVIQRALARRVGISSPAVSWHLRRLEGVGLVGHDRLGRSVRYYPAQEPRTTPATMPAASAVP